MYLYQNIHRHSYLTNIRVPDSVTSNEAYAKRAAELGHGIISSCEHGWQGRYIECFELAEQYNLKFVEAAEAYWVKDRFEKDRSNCHIVLAAKNENGRRALNKALSIANQDGFYGQARLDIPLILSLPTDDIIVQTACIAYWRYDDIDDITQKFAEHFNHFYLEVQPHNTEFQRKVNDHILELSNRYQIPIILGTDSHYIKPEDALERADYTASKGMSYPDEDGMILDYPDGDTVYARFAAQSVLGHREILTAMDNTNIYLEVENYDCPCFNHDIKMPTLYPGWTQEEKNAEYDRQIWDAWKKERANVDTAQWGHYESEIQKEVDIVHTTLHADYFLIDQRVIAEGKRRGGVITSTGRGSGPSFYTNKLLGLTEIDRIGAKVTMYPERFMSPTRILETHSLADIDINVANREPFLEAQKNVLGDDHSWEMIAYGTLKAKSAWKMYAKSQEVPFDIANEISDQIGRYEEAVKNAKNDDNGADEDEIDIYDYIDESYKDVFEGCQSYLGITSHVIPHPCATLVYQGNISEEIGLINVKGEICTVMDGLWAEQYKFLKNDILRVAVVDLISRTYQRVGIQRHTVSELLDICSPESPVWNVYKQSCTKGINQVEQPGTSHRVAIYSPKNITELCAFVAAVRPGFKSMYKAFESREHFEYGIPKLDAILQTEEMPNSFILYQELSMAVINYAGIPMSECYDIIKNIAKKRVEKVLKYKEQFIEGFKKSLMTDGEDDQTSEMVANEVWQILEDSSAYSFNASHSYSVAIDSLYGAFLKETYPCQFYETFLRILEEKGEKDRLNATKEEAEDYYGIRFLPYRFGQDNRDITANPEKKEITKSIASIKGYSKAIGNILWECGQEQHENFTSVLHWLDQHSIKDAKVRPLIKIGYFQEFGNSVELCRILDIWNFFGQGTAKKISCEKLAGKPLEGLVREFATNVNRKGVALKTWTITDMDGLLSECEKFILDQGIPEVDYKVMAQNQKDVLDYVDLVTNKKEDRRRVMVLDVFPLNDKKTGKPWGYRVSTKSIGTGKTAKLTIRAKTYEMKPFKDGAILFCTKCTQNKTGYWYLGNYEYVV